MPPESEPRPAESTDAELLAAARRGDAGAFEALYFRHRDFVVRVAIRFTRDEHAAWDVTQEVFAYLARRLPSLKLTSKLTTYLYPVTRSIAVSHARRAGPLPMTGEAAAAELAAAGVAPAADELRSSLLRAVDLLPDSQREVLLMRVVDEMSVEEVALALRVPPGTVKSRLHNALQALRGDPALRVYFAAG